MVLRFFGREPKSVFGFLGQEENSATFSVGWALSKSPSFLAAFVRKLADGLCLDHESGKLQRHEVDGGFTDIELRCKGACHPTRPTRTDREAGFDAGRCSLDTIQLLFQLCEAIADLAAIEIEIARAGASLPLAARRTTPAGAATRTSTARSPPAASPSGCAHDEGRIFFPRNCLILAKFRRRRDGKIATRRFVFLPPGPYLLRRQSRM